MDSGFCVHELERHQTEDTIDSHINGELTVIWRDWDKIIKWRPGENEMLNVKFQDYDWNKWKKE